MTLPQFRAIKEQRQWAAFAASLLDGPKLPSEAMDLFGKYLIEAGHYIREQIGDDRRLVCLLRHLLPPYTGRQKRQVGIYVGHGGACVVFCSPILILPCLTDFPQGQDFRRPSSFDLTV